MARCRYCNIKVSYLSDVCPKCGCTNPASVSVLPFDNADNSIIKIAVVGAIIGLLIGLYYGFAWYGVGGAILGAIVGIILGSILLQLLIDFLALVIIFSLIVGFIWLLLQLWGVGAT